jgi:hypothetical protein
MSPGSPSSFRAKAESRARALFLEPSSRSRGEGAGDRRAHLRNLSASRLVPVPPGALERQSPGVGGDEAGWRSLSDRTGSNPSRPPSSFYGVGQEPRFRGRTTAEQPPPVSKASRIGAGEAGVMALVTDRGRASCTKLASGQLTFYPVRVPAVGRPRDHNPVCCGLDAPGDGTHL